MWGVRTGAPGMAPFSGEPDLPVASRPALRRTRAGAGGDRQRLGRAGRPRPRGLRGRAGRTRPAGTQASRWRAAPRRSTSRLLIAGVGPGDDVLVSTFTFAATANPIVYLGATPVFVDSEHDLERQPGAPRRRHRGAGHGGPAAEGGRASSTSTASARTAADRCRLLDRHGVAAIEDAAEALGADRPGRPAGAFGAAAALSFNGNKIITTSGGGSARHRRRGARRPGPPPRHPGPRTGAALRARRDRLQLPALEPPGRRRPGRSSTTSTSGSRAGGRSASRYLDGARRPSRHRVEPGRREGRSNRWLTCITIDPATGGARDDPPRPRGRTTSRPGRPGSRCTSSRSSATPPAVLDGTRDRLFDTGLCLPSGSNLSADGPGAHRRDHPGRVAPVVTRRPVGDRLAVRSTSSSPSSALATLSPLLVRHRGRGPPVAWARRCSSASGAAGARRVFTHRQVPHHARAAVTPASRTRRDPPSVGACARRASTSCRSCERPPRRHEPRRPQADACPSSRPLQPPRAGRLRCAPGSPAGPR